MKEGMDFDIDTQWKLVGIVLEQFNNLELLATKILTVYVSPLEKRRDFFSKILLNNAVLPFGAKAKLLVAINNREKLVKLDKNKIHRILAIRNAIAHNEIATRFQRIIPEDPEEPISSYFELDSVKSDGSLETIDRDHALREFMLEKLQ